MILNLFVLVSFLVAAVYSGSLAELEGTWTTKSRKVLTGPGFYDPDKDELLEPKLTGISYSFSSSGHYEEAYYRAISNPTTPSCPKGIMQWQHGTFTVNANGSLTLTPIAIDGRQLMSDPCTYDQGIYTRYNQTEYFRSFNVYRDPYQGHMRLDLYAFDGAPKTPMHRVDQTPKLLPTTTLHVQATATAKSKRNYGRKRSYADGADIAPSFTLRTLVSMESLVNPDRWWWLGVIMTSIGAVAVFYF